MSRRRRAAKRQIDPDPIYKSYVLAKFINKVMISGKKSVARRIVYNALEKFAKKIKAEDPLQLLNRLSKTQSHPSKSNLAVSVALTTKFLSKSLLIAALRWRCNGSSNTPAQKRAAPWKKALATELADCFNNQGTTIKKKDDTHRMAEANKAFAHYKW